MKTADSVFRIAVAVTGHCVFCIITVVTEWLGSQVVSVLDLGAEGLPGKSLRQTVHTQHASVHQAAKLVAALLKVAGITAGLAESNGSLLPGL